MISSGFYNLLHVLSYFTQQISRAYKSTHLRQDIFPNKIVLHIKLGNNIIHANIHVLHFRTCKIHNSFICVKILLRYLKNIYLIIH